MDILSDSQYAEIRSLLKYGVDYDSPAAITLRNMLSEQGYDGIIYPNGFEGEGDSYIAFYNEQIVGREDDEQFQTREYLNEDKYSYESLVSKPDMKVTTVDDSVKYEPIPTIRKAIVNQAVKNTAEVGYNNESGNAVVCVKDIDTDVVISKNGLMHGLDRRLNALAPITLNAGKIIKNAIRLNELTPKSEHISNSYILIGMAKSQNNEPYLVSFIVNRATNEVVSVDVLYSINTKKEPARLIDAGVPAFTADRLTGSYISISQLLDYVNRYFPDILPEQVLRHYGYERRPDGSIGENALYQTRTGTLTDREILEYAAEKIDDSDMTPGEKDAWERPRESEQCSFCQDIYNSGYAVGLCRHTRSLLFICGIQVIPSQSKRGIKLSAAVPLSCVKPRRTPAFSAHSRTLPYSYVVSLLQSSG